MSRPLPHGMSIGTFFNCGLCLAELPDGQSPEEYDYLNIGLTPWGIQVWCRRHDCNVVHIDFEGQNHPAWTYRARIKGLDEPGLKPVGEPDG